MVIVASLQIRPVMVIVGDNSVEQQQTVLLSTYRMYAVPGQQHPAVSRQLSGLNAQEIVRLLPPFASSQSNSPGVCRTDRSCGRRVLTANGPSRAARFEGSLR